jgi:hypothetical protein
LKKVAAVFAGLVEKATAVFVRKVPHNYKISWYVTKFLFPDFASSPAGGIIAT